MFWNFIFKYFYPDQLPEDPEGQPADQPADQPVIITKDTLGQPAVKYQYAGFWESSHINGIDFMWRYKKVNSFSIQIDNRGWFLHSENANIKTIDVKKIIKLICLQYNIKYIETTEIAYLSFSRNKIRKIKNNNSFAIVNLYCSNNRIKSAKMYQVYFSNVFLNNKIKDASYDRHVESKNKYLNSLPDY